VLCSSCFEFVSDFELRASDISAERDLNAWADCGGSMPLDYERPAQQQTPTWHQAGRWLLFSLIAATFLTPFIVAAIAVLARLITGAIRNP
jgi:hypothetical protein